MENADGDSSKNTSEDLIQEEKFRAIIEFAPVEIGEIGLEPPRFRWVNEATCRILEYTEEELLAMNPFDLIVEESRQHFQERMRKILAGEKVTQSVDYKLKTKNGRILWANLTMNYLHKNGKVVGGLIFAQGVTQLKQSEEELRKSRDELETRVKERTAELVRSNERLKEEEKLLELERRRLDALLKLSQIGEATLKEIANFTLEQAIALTNSKIGFVGFLNEDETVYTLHAVSKDVVKECRVTGDPVQWHVVDAGIWADAIRERRTLFVSDYSKPHPRKRGFPPGHPYVEKFMVVPIIEGKRIVAVAGVGNKASDYEKSDERQIVLLLRGMWSHVQKAEAELRAKEAERLVAIGQTAGMVGHDIRNPLQAIVGDLYLAKSDLASMPESVEKEEVNESLAAIESSVGYIDKIVQDLQDFARPLKPVAQETDLGEVFQEVLFKNDIAENIEVSCEFQEEAKKPVTDPDLLKRILNNLVSNAVQAMPNGGKLDLQAFEEAGELVVTVNDTGVGISEEIKPKLFTPLFTTKSKGQGFGLAVVKRMTEALGGSVTFESEVGKGTKFIVRLPPQKKK